MSNKIGQLNQLKINGYKSIKSLDIKLNSINILIGSNGSGKSNFISFFKFIKEILDETLQLYVSQQGGANKILYFGKKQTNLLSFELYFPPNSYGAVLIPNTSDSLIFKNEQTKFNPSEAGYSYSPTTHQFAETGDKESRLNGGKAIEKWIVKYISSWKIYHFHDVGLDAKVKQSCNINNNETLLSNGENLPAFLFSIKKNNEKSYKKIIKNIQRVAPFFQDFILKPDINNEDMIRLKWKHKGSDDYFDVNDLSDGTLRFICLVTLLLQPNLPTIILLDEPELGLHPFALKLLAGIFRAVSRETQIIASTQSVTLADEFDVEDIIVVNRKDNSSVFERLDEEKYKNWLEEYTLGEIWQKNIIGGNPSYD